MKVLVRFLELLILGGGAASSNFLRAATVEQPSAAVECTIWCRHSFLPIPSADQHVGALSDIPSKHERPGHCLETANLIVQGHGQKHAESSPKDTEKHTESAPSISGSHSSSSNSASPTYLFNPAVLEERINEFKRMYTASIHFILPNVSAANAKAVSVPLPVTTVQPSPSQSVTTISKPDDNKGPEKPSGKKLPIGKPPSDFKITSIPLKNIHLSSKGHHTSKVNAAYAFHGDRLLINKHYNFEKDYAEKHGFKTSYGYAYRDKFNSHWHHSIWDPNFSCFYFYDQYSSSYYFWDDDDACYYPIWWTVDYAALHSY